MVKCCQMHGGRAWDVGLDVTNATSLATEHWWTTDFRMHGIFCGPRNCNEENIALVAIQHFIAMMLMMPVEEIEVSRDQAIGRHLTVRFCEFT